MVHPWFCPMAAYDDNTVLFLGLFFGLAFSLRRPALRAFLSHRFFLGFVGTIRHGRHRARRPKAAHVAFCCVFSFSLVREREMQWQRACCTRVFDEACVAGQPPPAALPVDINRALLCCLTSLQKAPSCNMHQQAGGSRKGGASQRQKRKSGRRVACLGRFFCLPQKMLGFLRATPHHHQQHNTILVAGRKESGKTKSAAPTG